MSEKTANQYMFVCLIVLGGVAFLPFGIGAVISVAAFLLMHPLVRIAVALTQIRNMQAPPPPPARHHP